MFQKHLRLEQQKKDEGEQSEVFLGRSERVTILKLIDGGQYSKNEHLSETVAAATSILPYIEPSTVLPFLSSCFLMALETALKNISKFVTTNILPGEVGLLCCACVHSNPDEAVTQLIKLLLESVISSLKGTPAMGFGGRGVFDTSMSSKVLFLNKEPQEVESNPNQRIITPLRFGQWISGKDEPTIVPIAPVHDGKTARFDETSETVRRLQFSRSVTPVDNGESVSGVKIGDNIDEDQSQEKPEMVYESKNKRKGARLRLFPPEVRNGEMIATIPQSVIDSQAGKWENTLIGHTIGADPSFKDMLSFVYGVWSFVNVPTVYKHKSFIDLKAKKICKRCSRRGPYSWKKLKIWHDEFTLKEEDLSIVPLWVTFPGLPLQFWSEEALGRIASPLGNPLCADKVTTHMERISYARVLIEVDITQGLSENVTIGYPDGRTREQPVHYEWKPVYC